MIPQILFGMALGIVMMLILAFTAPKMRQEQPPDDEPRIRDIYQRRWLLTYHEKDAYTKLKAIADELGLTLFVKVRLLDLVEPKRDIPKYKTYLYRIQAKHVDFVLCDEKLVAKYIIELDDSSHDAAERKARDKFVDEVLTSTGYKVLHIRNITDMVETWLREKAR